MDLYLKALVTKNTNMQIEYKLDFCLKDIIDTNLKVKRKNMGCGMDGAAKSHEKLHAWTSSKVIKG